MGEEWIVPHLVGTFALAIGPTIAITMQEMGHTIPHGIAIVE